MDKPTPPKTITTRMLGTGPAVEFVFLTDAIAHGEAMAAWGAAQEQAKLHAEIAGMPFEPNDWVVLHKEIHAQMAQYHKGHERYETARRMSPHQWKDAWLLNRNTGKPFDEIIDDLRPFMLCSKEINRDN